MRNFGNRHVLMASAALLTLGLFSSAQAGSPAYAHTYTAPTYYYQVVPSYHYVPVAPMVVAAPVYYYQTPYYYMATPAVATPAKPAKKAAAKTQAQPKVSPVQLYSNFTYAAPNPVVMIYPPLVSGFGYPVVMW
jgi:hypothetical protein